MGLLNQVRSKQGKTPTIATIHFEFMQEFGWISLNDFKELPLPTLFNLLEKVSERRKKEQDDLKSKRKR